MPSQRRDPLIAAGFLCSWAAAIFVAGCGASSSETKRRLGELEQRILVAQNCNDRLEERIIALEAALGPDGIPAAQRPEASPSSAGPEPANLPVVALRPDPQTAPELPKVGESESANRPHSGLPSETVPEEASDHSEMPPPTLIRIHGSTPEPGAKPPKSGPKSKAPTREPEPPLSYEKVRSRRKDPCAA